MTTLFKIKAEHASTVETYHCDDCDEEFSVSPAIVVDYCPRCGVAFESEIDETKGGG